MPEASDSLRVRALEQRVDVLEHALAESAGATCLVNLTKNVVPGLMHQSFDGARTVLNEEMGLPCDASFNEVAALWAERIVEEDRQGQLNMCKRERLLALFDKGETEISCQYHLLDAIGEPMLVEHRMLMYRDEQTGDVMLQSYVLDLADRSQMEMALRMSENANRAKTTFLSNMSHDIRTPMNAIIGFTSLAATHTEDPQLLKDYLRKIMASSNHLLSLINDVLDMSRIESGRFSIDERPNSLPTIMHDVRNMLQADIHAKRLKFLIDTVDVVDEDIVCDKLRLNQILINCMSNAVKFTPPGGTVGIKIVQRPSEDASEYAQFDFIISDTGIGMSPEFIEHIFEPFTREETVTNTGIPGTGLGMAITKNIVDVLGGTIEVESELGSGTVITVSLKFKTCSERPKRSAAIDELAGFRALVADDSMDACVSVCRMLEAIGMNPEWTMSGTEAVYKAKYAHEGGRSYRVFVIDWLMPDMNGVEVVRRIRAEIGDDTPIIVLTAYDWSEIEQEAREAGVTAFCAKPLFMSDLCDVLAGAVDFEKSVELPKTGQSSFVSGADAKKVLVVEDNDLNREIATAILSERGAVIEEAENGAIGLEMVRTSEPGYYSMVLMDIQMPVMDGLDAARAIRALDREDAETLPIVAVSANAFEEDKVRSIQAGMNDHIAKPFEKDAIDALFERYLQ